MSEEHSTYQLADWPSTEEKVGPSRQIGGGAEVSCEVENCLRMTRTEYAVADPDGGHFQVRLCEHHATADCLGWEWKADHNEYIIRDTDVAAA